VRIAAWLTSLLFTLAVELPVGGWRLREHPAGPRFAWLAAGTALTHPLLWWVLPRLFTDRWTFVVVGELLVVAVEAAVLRVGLGARGVDAVSASFLANGASYLGGVWLRAAGWWPN
jgi:hypothetical protein